MKAIDRPFTKIINGTMQFVIPVFQRDYTWSEAQCEQLWQDILEVAKDETGRCHFLGSVVYVSTPDTTAGFTRWLLIDGQQRVTTFILMLAALRDYIQENNWSDSNDELTAKKIEAYFLKNLEEKKEKSHKLVLRGHDQSTLAAILDRKEFPADFSERIAESFHFFKERMSDVDPSILYAGIGRLEIVDVTLDHEKDDPQLIFESLNSTGMDLSQADLIRNFILMGLPEEEQTRLYEEIWYHIENLFRASQQTFDDFARDYLALKTQASKQEKAATIYSGFRRFFPQLVSEVGSLEDALSDIHRFAVYYAAFSLGANLPARVSLALSNVRRLVDAPAILVMSLFDCYDDQRNLSEDEFIEALELIESYIVRRAICGEQTRGYWQVFAGLAYKINSEDPLDDLKVGFARQRENYRFPNDMDFSREMFERDLYSLRICRTILERLENNNTNEPEDTSRYSIEHIMPQNKRLSQEWREMLGDNWQEIREVWLHRLGNLTLTGYNSEYSDRPFNEKKTIENGFNESAVRLNKLVREKERWTSIEIEERGQALTQKSLSVWGPLQVDPQKVEEAELRDKQIRAARKSVEQVKMSEIAQKLFSQLRKKILEIDSEIIEIAETKSVSYHSKDFFLEVLPRAYRLTLLLPMDFNEIDNSSGLAEDATQKKFYFYAKYEGGVAVRLSSVDCIEPAISLIKQSYDLATA